MPLIRISPTDAELLLAEIPLPIAAPFVEVAVIVPLLMVMLPASPYLPEPIAAPSSLLAVNVPQEIEISPTVPPLPEPIPAPSDAPESPLEVLTTPLVAMVISPAVPP